MSLSLRTRPSLVVAGLATVGAMLAPTVAEACHRIESGAFFTYSDKVPAGATAFVDVSRSWWGHRTYVTLRLRGFRPGTAYGAHAHTRPCSATDPSAAGPHYQYRQDPVTPSTDPAYANPRNEIWLDLTTNAAGNGRAFSAVPWTFPADRRAKSVVIHAQHTSTGPHDSGVAGARLACVDVAF